MKCCVSTDVGIWTKWLTFEPDHSSDAGTGLLSPLSYKECYAEFYVGKIRRIRIGRCMQRDVVLKWFYGLPLQRRVVLQWFHWLRQWVVETPLSEVYHSIECPSSYKWIWHRGTFRHGGFLFLEPNLVQMSRIVTENDPNLFLTFDRWLHAN